MAGLLPENDLLVGIVFVSDIGVVSIVKFWFMFKPLTEGTDERELGLFLIQLDRS